MQQLLKKKYIFLATGVFVAGFTAYWLYSHAFIEISVNPSEPSAEYTYVLINQKSGARTETKSSKSTFKKLVSRGSYELMVKQSKKSHVSVKQTGGFLGSTKINTDLVSETERTFVGNNPNSCMYFFAERLVSAPCNSLVEDMEVHIPASSTIATYTKKAAGPAAYVEGFLPATTSAQAIINAEAEVDGEGKIHALYSVSPDGLFDPNSYRELDHLESGKIYDFVGHEAGYIAISSDGSEVLYYPSFSQTPENIEVKRPNDSEQQYKSTSSNGNTLVMVYSTDHSEHAEFENPSGLRSHSQEVETKNQEKNSSTILVYSKQVMRQVELSESVIQAISCGESKLCVLLASGKLNVYEVVGDSAELQFSLTGTLGIRNIKNNFYAVTSEGILQLKPEQRDGHIVFSFGDYSYCGLAQNTDRLIVCIADQKGNRRAIHVNETTTLTEAIDEKVMQLQNLKDLKYVSIYGNYIHLAAELGRLEYQPSIGGYGYDPETIKSTNTAITNEIKRLGIDTSKYTIVNPYQ